MNGAGYAMAKLHNRFRMILIVIVWDRLNKPMQGSGKESLSAKLE